MVEQSSCAAGVPGCAVAALGPRHISHGVRGAMQSLIRRPGAHRARRISFSGTAIWDGFRGNRPLRVQEPAPPEIQHTDVLEGFARPLKPADEAN